MRTAAAAPRATLALAARRCGVQAPAAPLARIGACGKPSLRRAQLAPRASAGDVEELQAAKEALAKNLQAKQESWSAQAKAAGGVIAEGVDSQTAPAQSAASLPSVDKDTFYPTINGAGDTLVVVDFYTDWCGPCKLMMPKLVEMSQEYKDVKFVKCNCNKEFKDIGKALGIKVAPTFHLYRQGKQLAVMTGAKVDELRELILAHK